MLVNQPVSILFATALALSPISAWAAGETPEPTVAEASTRTMVGVPLVAYDIGLPPVELPATEPAAAPASPAAEAIAQPAPEAVVAPSAADGNAPLSSLTSADMPADCDLWQRIRNGFAMRELNSPLVARYEKWYANHPDYVERMTDRARRYLHFIVEEVEKRGMPMEIALLPMIESAFNPEAYSVARASGIWQFIPYTGKKYGMQQNWWHDKRRDIISATNGALDYLQTLHDEFGDWELALAAYNWGEGAVRRAQQKNRQRKKPVNYVSLRMPKETRGYVPKLMAVRNIVNDPARFGLTLQPIPDQPYFAAISTTHHMDVKLAAELADISMEEFNALNPAYSRPVILQEDDNLLLLPADKVETFRVNLEGYNEPLVSWQAYRSKKGESLEKLASRFDIGVEKLKLVNGIHPRAKQCEGQTLLVPRINEEESKEFEAFNTHLPPSDPLLLNAITHTVRKGDTLSAIARRYHVKLANLKSWNSGVKILRPGQKIYVVPRSKPSSPAQSARASSPARSRTKTVITNNRQIGDQQL